MTTNDPSACELADDLVALTSGLEGYHTVEVRFIEGCVDPAATLLREQAAELRELKAERDGWARSESSTAAAVIETLKAKNEDLEIQIDYLKAEIRDEL